MADERKKRDLSHVEFAEHPPKWVKQSDVSFIRETEDIREVIRFFVVNSPCANVSARGIDLTKYNWREKNPPKDKYLYNRLLSVAELFENDSLFIGESVDTTKDLFSTAGMKDDFWRKYTSNRIAIVNGGNLIMTIFKVIRNCFAHCRFTVVSHNVDYIIAMENGVASGERFEVKGRLILKLSTLVEWIRIIKEEHSDAEEHERSIAIQVEAALMNVIRVHGNEKIYEIIDKVPFDKSIVKEAKKRLITNGVIEYSSKEKKWIIVSEEENEQTNS